MKRVFKRSISWILSLALILSMVPAYALDLSSIFGGETRETTDVGATPQTGNVTTSSFGGETPEKPSGGEGEGDLSWKDVKLDSVKIFTDGTWKVTASHPTNNGNPGSWFLAFIPVVKKTGDDYVTIKGLSSSIAASSVQTKNSLIDQLATDEATGLTDRDFWGKFILETSKKLNFVNKQCEITSGTYGGTLPTLEDIHKALDGKAATNDGTVITADTQIYFDVILFTFDTNPDYAKQADVVMTAPVEYTARLLVDDCDNTYGTTNNLVSWSKTAFDTDGNGDPIQVSQKFVITNVPLGDATKEDIKITDIYYVGDGDNTNSDDGTKLLITNSTTVQATTLLHNGNTADTANGKRKIDFTLSGDFLGGLATWYGEIVIEYEGASSGKTYEPFIIPVTISGNYAMLTGDGIYYTGKAGDSNVSKGTTLHAASDVSEGMEIIVLVTKNDWEAYNTVKTVDDLGVDFDWASKANGKTDYTSQFTNSTVTNADITVRLKSDVFGATYDADNENPFTITETDPMTFAEPQKLSKDWTEFVDISIGSDVEPGVYTAKLYLPWVLYYPMVDEVDGETLIPDYIFDVAEVMVVVTVTEDSAPAPTPPAQVEVTWKSNYPIGASFDSGTGTDDRTSLGTPGEDTLTPPAAPDAPKGYTFDGWYDAASGGNKVTDSDKYPEAAKDYYAHWTRNTVDYKVTLKLDSGTYTAFSGSVMLQKGSGTTYNGTISSGAVTINGVPEDDGYTLTLSDNNGTVYTATVNVNSTNNSHDIQFWTVTFDANGGSWRENAPTEIVLNGDHASAPSTTPTWTAHTFTNEWYEEAGMTNAVTFATRKIENKEIFYAGWEVTTHKLTVNTTLDGTVAAVTGYDTVYLREAGAAQNADAKYTITLSSGTATKTVNEGTYDLYVGTWKFASGVNINQDKTQTAEFFTANFYTDKGDSAPIKTVTVKKGGNVESADAPTPTKDGHQFANQWKNVSDDSVVSLPVSNVTAKQEYYATWTANKATITVYKDGTSSSTTYPLTSGGTVTLKDSSGKVVGTGTIAAKGTSCNIATGGSNLLKAEDTYDIYLDDKDTGENITISAGTENTGNIIFYTLTVNNTDTHGNVAMDTSGSPTVGTATTANGVYLPGTTVYINAKEKTNYEFDAWTGDTSKVTGLCTTTAANTITTTANTTTLTATFKKVAYSGTITVKVNGAQIKAIGSSNDIVKVEVTKKTGTSSETPVLTQNTATGGELSWTVDNLRAVNTYTVTVTSKTGKFAKWEITGEDGATVEANFYTVSVVGGAGNGSNAPYFTDKNTTAGHVTSIVMPAGEKIALKSNPTSSAFTCTGWKQSNDSALPGGVLYTGSHDSFELALGSTYTASEDLAIKPLYTFSTTVNTKYGTTLTAPGGKVELKEGSNTTELTASSTTGVYTASELDPAKTYDVWVNGFYTGVDIAVSDAGGKKDVPLVKITATTSTASLPSDPNTAKIGLTSSSTGASVYVPSGATSGATLALSATAGTGYRLADTVWTNTDSRVSFTTNAASGVLSVSNITADATVTANFTQQYTVTVAKTNADTNDTAKITDKESTGTTIKTGDMLADVDTGTWVKLSATVDTASTKEFVGWKLSSGRGSFYSSSTTTGTALSADSNGYYSVGTTDLWFVPSADATVEAVFQAKHYDVTVVVKKNNEAQKDVTVNLTRNGTTGTATVTAATTNASGEAKFHVLPDEYDILTDVIAATTGTPEDCNVDVTVSKDNVTVTLDYYTVELAKSITSGAHFVDFGTSAPAADATAAKTILAYQTTGSTTAAVNNTVQIAATANNHSGTKPFCRFNKWVSKAKDDTALLSGGQWNVVETTAINCYTLPSLASLSADGSKVTGKGILLTAEFQKEFKVTLKNSNTSSGTLVKPTIPSGATGTVEGNNAPYTVFVDDGDSISSTLTAASGMRVDHWQMSSGAATIHDVVASADLTEDSGTSGKYPTTATSFTITPSADTELEIFWEKDTFTGIVTLVTSDGTTAYTAGNTNTASEWGVTVEFKAQDGTNDQTNQTSSADIKKITTGNNNQWQSEVLSGTKTYDVYINGVKTGQTLSKPASGSNAEVTVKMYAIDVGVKVDGTANTNDASHEANLAGKKWTYYLPESTATEGTTTKSLSVYANAGTGYRLNNKSGETLWETTSDKTTGISALPTTASDTVTVDCKTIKDDYTIYANFTSVYTLTVAAGNGGTAGVTKANGVASTTNPATIDNGKSAEIQATASTASTTAPFNSYAFTKWTESVTGGAWDTGKSATDATSAYKPAKDVTLTANFKHLSATSGSSSDFTNVDWSATGGLTITVKTGYTGGDATITIANNGSDNTGDLTASVSDTTGGILDTTTDPVLGTDVSGSAGPLNKVNTSTVTVTVNSGKAKGTYTDKITVTDNNGLTITVPVTLKVEDPDEFDVTIKTFLDGEPASGTPSGANINDVYLLSGSTAIQLTESATGSGIWTNGATKLGWNKKYEVCVNGAKVSDVTIDNSKVASGDSWDITALTTVQWSANSYTGAASGKPTGSYSTKNGLGSYTATASLNPGTTLVLPVGTAVNLDGTANKNASGTSGHYRFDGWEAWTTASGTTATTGTFGTAANASTTYTVAAVTQKTPSVFLNPKYQELYKVTVALNTSGSATDYKATQKDSTSNSGTSIFVDAGKTVTLSTGTINTGYYFKEWQNTDVGTAGAFGTTTGTTGNTKYHESAEYTPGSDVTLTLYVWKDAEIGSEITHTLGETTDKNTIWTKNDALDTSYVVSMTNSSSTSVTITASDYTVDNTNTKIELKASYLNTLTPGTYTLKIAYDLDESTTHPNKQSLEKTVNVVVKESDTSLTEVNIKVETGKNTLNVNSTTVDDQMAIYQDHTPTSIQKDNLLTFTWYYTSSAPTQGTYTGTGAPSGATAIGTTHGTSAGFTTSKDANVVLNGANKDALKGQYVFAVVEATNSGKGKVITNAISVDYDGKIIVQKDGANVGSDNGGYTVYLVPQVTGTTNADTFTTVPSNAIVTSWNNTDRAFVTSSSALTGGVTYDVYVNEVEGKKTAGSDTFVKVSDISVSPSSQSATVDFYSVTLTDVNATKTFDLNGKTTSASEHVNETFSAYPKLEAKTGNSVEIASGKGVLKSATVKANVTAATGWTQDYLLTWQYDTGVTGTFANGENEQTPTQAVVDGNYQYTSSLASKVEITAKLDQKAYTVKGNVWSSTGGGVKSATLTSNEHSFVGTTTDSGKNGSVFTFKVPKSNVKGEISDDYVISAVAFDGTTNYTPISNIEKYIEYIDAHPTGDASTGTVLTGDKIAAVSADNDKAFTIVVRASTWSLKLSDDDDPSNNGTGSNTKPGTEPTTVTTVKDSFSGVYDNYSALTRTVTLENTGNTTLTVTMTADKDDTVFYNDTTNNFAKYEDSNWKAYGSGKFSIDGFVNGANTFDLAPGAKKEFTITVPEDLFVDDGVYSLKFTSVEKGDAAKYGPKMTYEFTAEVTEVTVNSASITAPATGSTTLTANVGFSDADTTNVRVPVSGDTGAEEKDVTYTWYYSDSAIAPTLDASGAPTGTGYTAITTSEATLGYHGLTMIPTGTALDGKYIYVVAKGQNNAKNAAVSESYKQPYDAMITVYENTTPTSTKANYAVYLLPSTESSFSTSAAIQATATTTATDGKYTARGLIPGVKYTVYTNVVGANTTSTTFTATSETIIGVADNTASVYYYKVELADTAIDNIYTGLTNTTKFETGTTLTTAKPTASVNVNSADVAVADGTWVRNGQTINLNRSKDWGTKDYTFAWTRDATSAADDASGNPQGTKTLSGVNIRVESKITLNLYSITAYVEGTGSVTKITMADSDVATFTSATAGSGEILGTGTASASIAANGSVVFKVPAGNYVVTGTPDASSTLKAYRANKADATEIASHTETVTVGQGAGDFVVVLSATGRNMTVVDNAKSQGDSQMSAEKNASGNAAYGSSATHTDAEQSVTLPFGYTNDKTITLTLTNAGNAASDVIYNVAASTPTNSDGAMASTFSYAGETSMALGAISTVTVPIAGNLNVGTYTVTIPFSYDIDADATASSSTNYVLTIIVEPMEFTAVTVKDSQSTPTVFDGTTSTDGTTNLTQNSYTTEVVDDFTATTPKLVKGTDYTYQWYVTEHGASVSESWTADTVTVTATKDGSTVTVTDITPTSNPETLPAAEVAKQYGKDIYLVVTAIHKTGDGAKNNVIEAAISAPVPVKYPGYVYFNKDSEAATANPSYTVTFRPAGATDGTNDIAATWNGTNNRYESNSMLEPGTTYNVMVGRYQGDSTATVNCGSINGSDVSNHNAMPTPENYGSNEKVVDVYTVKAKATELSHYKADLKEMDSTSVTTELYVGTDTLVSGTNNTVLKGQSVTAKASATWDEDYTWTWMEAVDAKDDGTVSGFDNTLTDKTTGETATTTGESWIINETTTIGGKMVQTTYTVTANVSGSSGSVESTTLTFANGDSDSRNGKTFVYGTSGTYTGTLGDTNSDSNWNPGEKVEFTVVKGTYTITAAPGTGTVISGMSWNGGSMTTGTSISSGEVKTNAYYTIHLVESKTELTLSDKNTVGLSENAPSYTNGIVSTRSDKGNANQKAKYIYNQIADKVGCKYGFMLTLTNSGNVDMTVKLDVFTFASGTTNIPYNDPNSTDWGTPLYTANDTLDASGSSVKFWDNGSQKVATLTQHKGPVTVKAKNGDQDTEVSVGAIIIESNARNQDDGILVYRFTATDPDNNVTTLYYTLNLTVEPLPIVSADVEAKDASGNAVTNPTKDDTVQIEGYSTTTDNSLDHIFVNHDQDNGTTPATKASDNSLVDGDFAYQWVRANRGTTVDKSDFKLNSTGNGIELSTTADSDIELISGATGKKYTLTAADDGMNLYLIVLQSSNTSNAEDFCVSEAIKVKKTGAIQVNVDGTKDTTGSYKLKLVELNNTSEETSTVIGSGDIKWDSTNGVYTAAMKPETSYNVYAEAYKDGYDTDDNSLVKTGVVAEDSETAVVNFYTFQFDPNVDVKNEYEGFKEYLPGSTVTDHTATDDNDIQAALSAALGDGTDTNFAGKFDTDSASGVKSLPVLSGQTVKLTMDTTEKNGVATPATKEGWTEKQDYSLSTENWSIKIGSADKTDGIEYTNLDSGTNSFTGNGITIASGVQDRLHSAKLVQKLYDVTFGIVDNNSGTTASVASATLDVDNGTGKETGVSSFTALTGEVKNGGTHGKTVEFKKVPKSESLIVAAAAGTGTVVTGYKWNDSTTALTGAVDTKAGATVGTLTNTAKNVIYIEAQEFKVEWQDNYAYTIATTKPSDQFVAQNTFNRQLVYGYDNTNPDETYTLRVYNKGNYKLTGFYIDAEDLGDFTSNITTGAKHFDKTGAQVGSDYDATATTGITLGVDEYVEFTVTVKADQPYSATAYADKFTAKMNETLAENVNASHEPKYTVKKAPITYVNVVDVTAPAVGAAPDTTASVNLWPGLSANILQGTSSVDVRWGGTMDSSGNFAAGRTYTATVILTPKDNYEFVDETNGSYIDRVFNADGSDFSGSNTAANATDTGYFMLSGADKDAYLLDNTTKAGDSHVTITKESDGTLKLVYTFPATAATLTLVADSILDASSESTMLNTKNQGKLEMVTLTADGEQDVYYVLVKGMAITSGTTGYPGFTYTDPSASDILAGTVSGNIVASGNLASSRFTDKKLNSAETFTGLDVGTGYRVYAVAVPKGTDVTGADKIAAAVAGGQVSAVAHDEFTTPFRVEAKMPDGQDYGTSSIVTPGKLASITSGSDMDYDKYVTYVQAGDTTAWDETNSTTKSVSTGTTELKLFVDSAYQHQSWSINAGTGTLGGLSGPDANQYTTENYTPGANSVLVANFNGEPKVVLHGNPRGNLLNWTYDSTITVLDSTDGGRVNNEGTTSLTGDATLIVTNKYVYRESEWKEYTDAMFKADMLQVLEWKKIVNDSTKTEGEKNAAQGKIDTLMAEITSPFFSASTGTLDTGAGSWTLPAGKGGTITVKPWSTDGNAPGGNTESDYASTNRLTAKYAETNAYSTTNTSGNKNISFRTQTTGSGTTAVTDKIGTYEGILRAYDPGNLASYTAENLDPDETKHYFFDSMAVTIQIVDEGWFGQPLDKVWDLNPRSHGENTTGGVTQADSRIPVTHTDWEMSMETAGYNKDEARKLAYASGTVNGSSVTWNPEREIEQRLYQYAKPGTTSNLNARTFNYYATSLRGLIYDGFEPLNSSISTDKVKVQRGDSVTYTFTLKNEDGKASTKAMSLDIKDTRPDVELNDMTNTYVAVGNKVTASVKVTQHDNGPDDQPSYTAHDNLDLYGDSGTDYTGLLKNGQYDVVVTWYRVPTDETVTDVASLKALVTDGKATVVKKTGEGSVTGAASLEYTAVEADKGYNLYCTIEGDNVWYVGEDVSEAVFVGSTMKLEGFRTGTAKKHTDGTVTSDEKVNGLATATLDTATHTASASFAITAADTVLGLNTARQDAAKKYFFVNWDDVKTAWGDGTDPVSAGGTYNPNDKTEMGLNYTVAGADTTLIAYYDLLPELAKANANKYDQSATDVEADRTLNYTSHDGSNNVRVVITPKSGSSFIGGEDSIVLTTADYTVTTNAGKDVADTYVLTAQFIKDNLQTNLTGGVFSDGEYVITFYDLEKGAQKLNESGALVDNDDGHSEYDKSIDFTVTRSGIDLKLISEDTDKTSPSETKVDAITDYHGEVKIGADESHTQTAVTGTTHIDNDAGGKAALNSEGTANAIKLEAMPHVGYKFAGWYILTKDAHGNDTYIASTHVDAADYGTFGITSDPDAKGAVSVMFTPKKLNVVIEARFTTEQSNGHATVKKDKDNTYNDSPYVSGMANKVDVEVKGDNAQTDFHSGTAVYSLATTTDDAAYTNTLLDMSGAAIATDKFIKRSDETNGDAWLELDKDTGEITLIGTVPSEVKEGSYDIWLKAEITDTSATPKTYTTFVKFVLTVEGNAAIYFGDDIRTTTTENVNLKLNKGDAYSAQSGSDTVTVNAPKAMEFTAETYRKNESYTYLDEVPVYTVRVKGTSVPLYNVKVAEVDLLDDDGRSISGGFKTVNGLPTTAQLNPTGGFKYTTDSDIVEFQVTLCPLSTTSDCVLWAGKHAVKYKVTGYADANDESTKVEATYTLIVNVDQRVIESAKPTLTGGVVTDIVGTLKDIDTTGSDNRDLTVKDDTYTDVDGKKNVPVTAQVTKDSVNDVEKVVLTANPNYIFQDSKNNYPLNNTWKPEIPDSKDTLTYYPTILKFHDTKVGEAYSKHQPMKDYSSSLSVTTGTNLADATKYKYVIDLSAWTKDGWDIEVTETNTNLTTNGGLLTPYDVGTGRLPHLEVGTGDDKRADLYELTFPSVDTSKTGTYTLVLKAKGASEDGGDKNVEATYTFTLKITTPPTTGNDPIEEECPNKVFYWLGTDGTTSDATIESVYSGDKPKAVPSVTALNGLTFQGWSLTKPEAGKSVKIVDPTTMKIEKDTTFYAVYASVERPYHEHYVIGYPNGNFGPADNINRASVATIIARAILPGFVEGADYGNPGGYSDVNGHWAESAIAYCSKFGVFEGYLDGTFKPDQNITRQEIAVVIARIDGMLSAGNIPFSDADEIGAWATDGIYTAYTKGWINGYTDGTFRPTNPIRRDETVKIFNAYLNRGVDAEGLNGLKEYVHSGVASNITGNGEDEYMTWPDVPKTQWAYYEIIEAANDHEYEADLDGSHTVPEQWTKCWIDEKWRYHDDLNDGGHTDAADRIEANENIVGKN